MVGAVAARDVTGPARTADGMTYAIETEQLTRRFHSKRVLRGVDLRVETGSVYAFLGPNGAGKTTTIKVLMNLLEPSGGSSHVLGTPSPRLGPAQLQHIGYVSENQELPLWMTLRQLIDFCKPLYPTWDDTLCRQLVSQFDLPRKGRLRSFSRGMRMKAALVVSLAYRPKLLVLDEPFTGLDPLVRDELVEGMLAISGESDWTVFVCSHDLAEVENLASHVGFLREGKLLVSEERDALQERFREVEVTLAHAPPERLDWPKDWLHVRLTANVLRFVAREYDEPLTRAQVRNVLGETEDIRASRMSLREVFVVLARGGWSQELPA